MTKSKATQLNAELLTLLYARVSTDRQASEGVSVESQETKLRAMALVHGAAAVELITDPGQSAKDLRRPGMQRLLELVNAGRVKTVIVFKLDRLTRSILDLGELLQLFDKKHVTLVSLTESLDTGSAGGRLCLNLLISVAQWQREYISEQVATALRFKRSARRVYTRLDPYGYRRDGDALVPVPDEQNTILEIHTMRQDGLSLRAICRELNERGVLTKQGKLWAPQTVSDVLSNPLNVAA